MAELAPTVDELLGPAAPDQVPTVDEFLQPAPQSTFFQVPEEPALQRLFNAYIGASERAFGDEPLSSQGPLELSPETEQALRRAGVWNDYERGQRNFNAEVRERVWKGFGAALYGTMRAGYAALSAPVGAAAQALEDARLLELAERFHKTFTGLGTISQEITSEEVEKAVEDPGLLMAAGPFGEANAFMVNARRAANLRVDVPKWRSRGVGVDEKEYFEVEPLKPEQAAARVEAAKEAGVPVQAPLPPPTRDELARRIDTPTFEQYDALAAAKTAHRERLRTLAVEREALPEAVQAQEEINTILGKVNGVPERLTKKAAARLDEAIARLDRALNVDTPEMAKTRKALMQADEAQRDLATKVTSAYQQADELMPVEPKVVKAVQEVSEGKPPTQAAEAIEREQVRKTVGPPRAPGTVRFYHGGIDTPQSGGGRWVSPNAEYAANYRQGATLYYVDVPIGHPMEVKARAWDDILDADTNQVGTYRSIELPEELAQKMQPVEQAERVEPPQQPRSATPVRTTTQLRAIEGTGATKTLTLSEKVEAKAIENKFTETFGDLPEYAVGEHDPQFQIVAETLASDYEKAKRIAFGQEAPPKGVHPEAFFVGVEAQATAAGDAETLRRLAQESTLPRAAKTMGQRIRLLGERSPNSPVGMIQKVQAARQAALDKKNALAFREAEKEIKAVMRRSAPKRDAWVAFLNEIRCQ